MTDSANNNGPKAANLTTRYDGRCPSHGYYPRRPVPMKWPIARRGWKSCSAAIPGMPEGLAHHGPDSFWIKQWWDMKLPLVVNTLGFAENQLSAVLVGGRLPASHRCKSCCREQIRTKAASSRSIFTIQVWWKTTPTNTAHIQLLKCHACLLASVHLFLSSTPCCSKCSIKL